MNMSPLPQPSRRELLARLAQASAAGSLPLGLGLSCLSAAAQAASPANAEPLSLVCIMLAGGNDQSNTVVPLESAAYAAYQRARGELALDRAGLSQALTAGKREIPLGLHPALKNVAALIRSGTGAVVANAGVLAEPINVRQWNGGTPSVAVPRQLFSHADQQALWETGFPNPAFRTGWLGRMADLLQVDAGAEVPSSISVAGNTLMIVGEKQRPYQITPSGAVPLAPFASPYGVETGELRSILTQTNQANLMEQELGQLARRAFVANGRVAAAVAKSEGLPAFAGGRLGAQLRMIARLIEARRDLGHKRQMFYAQHGGYDFHSNLQVDQAARLGELDAALGDFQAFLVQRGLSESVTTFTVSDFGRALQSNGKGSDHGWGAHHVVLGGRVKGGRLYGTWPEVGLRTNDDAGNGRLIPSTSLEQYLAPLAKWFGVPKEHLKTIFPNAGRFDIDKFDYFAPA